MPWLQENILAESSAMIPDTRQRLEQACEQLQAALVGAWPGGWGGSRWGPGQQSLTLDPGLFISPQEDAPPTVPEVTAAQEELQLATETLNGQGV